MLQSSGDLRNYSREERKFESQPSPHKPLEIIQFGLCVKLPRGVCLDLHLITPSLDSTASDRCTSTSRSASSHPNPPNHTAPSLREELQKEGVAQDSDLSRGFIGSGRLGASVRITKPSFLRCTKVDELSTQRCIGHVWRPVVTY